MFSKRFMLAIAFFVFCFYFGCSSDSSVFQFTPSKLTFENTNISESKTLDVVILNKSGDDISITDTELYGSDEFSIESGGTLPINIAKDAEHTISVKFEPKIDGLCQAGIMFTYDENKKPVKFYLKGIGVAIPKITPSETSFDFNYKLTNSTTDHSFVITNDGSKDLNLSSISFDGAGSSAYNFVTGDTTPQVITPGLTHTITVQFAPTTDGLFQCNLLIEHDALTTSPLSISLSGEAFAHASMIDITTTSPIDFGSVANTIYSMKPIEIKSYGLSPLEVSLIDFATGTEFSVDHIEDVNGSAITLPATIPIGDKIIAYIKFKPSSNINFTDTLSIKHDAMNESSPINFELKGIGRDELIKKFSFSGSMQQWTLPVDVSSIIVECYGAEGYGCDGGVRGLGGMAKAIVQVPKGSNIYVYVGGKSSNYAGGWNGGGECSDKYNGAGGGGASDVRIGGDDLTDRKVVAAGGGGAGFDSGKGGDGGGLIGDDGIGGYNNYPGKGGTQTAGGVASSIKCTDGSLGNGGKGVGSSAGGGGGGGGYYGGAGGFCSGGGGGSSYNDAPGNTDKSTATGVRLGDGEIIIRY